MMVEHAVVLLGPKHGKAIIRGDLVSSDDDGQCLACCSSKKDFSEAIAGQPFPYN